MWRIWKSACTALYARTNYDHYEVLVIENNSTDPATFDYYRTLPDRYEDCRVVYYKGGFNFSAINNFGRRSAKGQYLLLLNNDVEVLSHDWLGELVAEASQPGVAASGAMLYYPDNTIQHAGVITGLGGYAGHSHKYHRRIPAGICSVWPPCRITPPSPLPACWCAPGLRRPGRPGRGLHRGLQRCGLLPAHPGAGWRIVWTPYAELVHYESKSRGSDEQDPVKKARFDAERARLYQRHGREKILHDPYYNPNLSLDYEDFRESADLRSLKDGGMDIAGQS